MKAGELIERVQNAEFSSYYIRFTPVGNEWHYYEVTRRDILYVLNIYKSNTEINCQIDNLGTLFLG